MTPAPFRETIRCIHCQLFQFMTSNRNCRKCHKCLDHPEADMPRIAVAPDVPPVILSLGDSLGVVIHAVRVARGLSQRQMARIIHRPRTYIAKMENGNCSPCYESVKRLSAALEIDPIEVLLIAEQLAGRSLPEERL